MKKLFLLSCLLLVFGCGNDKKDSPDDGTTTALDFTVPAKKELTQNQLQEFVYWSQKFEIFTAEEYVIHDPQESYESRREKEEKLRKAPQDVRDLTEAIRTLCDINQPVKKRWDSGSQSGESTTHSVVGMRCPIESYSALDTTTTMQSMTDQKIVLGMTVINAKTVAFRDRNLENRHGMRGIRNSGDIRGTIVLKKSAEGYTPSSMYMKGPVSYVAQSTLAGEIGLVATFEMSGDGTQNDQILRGIFKIPSGQLEIVTWKRGNESKTFINGHEVGGNFLGHVYSRIEL